MTRKSSNIILMGIIAGVLLSVPLVGLLGENIRKGLFFGDLFHFLGTFFLMSLRMIVVPLVFASVVVGITGLGDVRKLGGTGLRTLAYYAMTTGIAVLIGIILVCAIQPGANVDTSDVALDAEMQQKVESRQDQGWADILLTFVHPNIVGAFAEMKMLPIITFSLIFGGVLTTLGKKSRPVIDFFKGFNEAIMKMVHLIMWMAPIGIMGLVTHRFAMQGEKVLDLLASLGLYMGTVLLGLAIHFVVVLPFLCKLLGKRNPFRHFLSMFPAILTAWSTASSSATLPLTIKCAEERAGVNPKASGFVLPLGATINMDGTALYESVAAIFIAQAYNIPLSTGAIVIIFITATLASIGAAGIPEAGLFTMLIVLTAVGLPLEGIGLLLAVDWFLDRFRTATNVWGDSVGAAYIDHATANS